MPDRTATTTERSHQPQSAPLDALKKASGIGPDLKVKLGEMPLAPFGGAILTSAKDILTPAAKAMTERLFQQANPIFRGLQKAGAFAGDRNVQLGRAISTSQVPLPAELTPMGGEAAYNALRPVVKAVKDPLENIYQHILAKGGR